MIAIIDGCGTNIASVQYAIERLNRTAIVTTSIEVIKAATHVIIPGVSTAKRALDQLARMNLLTVIPQLTQPVLGICSGMQILFDSCQEGEVQGLGIFQGRVEKLQTSLPLPHMGWNTLQFVQENPLLAGMDHHSAVYFVHSFAATCHENTVASCQYGHSFSAIVVKNNFVGVQFHPERSGKVGAQLLKNFLNTGCQPALA